MAERKAARAKTGGAKKRSPEELRQRILAAATEEFEQYGFAGATTAGIAQRADVSQAQMFRYFASKAELFRAAVFEPLNRHFLEFLPTQISDISDARSYEEKARLYINELQDFLSEHSNLWLSLLVAEKYARDAGPAPTQFNGLQAYFERGAATMKSMTTRPKVEPEFLVRVSFAGLVGCILLKDWLFPEGMANEKQIRAAINEFILDGVNTGRTEPAEAPASRKRTPRRNGRAKPPAS